VGFLCPSKRILGQWLEIGCDCPIHDILLVKIFNNIWSGLLAVSLSEQQIKISMAILHILCIYYIYTVHHQLTDINPAMKIISMPLLFYKL
jgi:hypothetical protein